MALIIAAILIIGGLVGGAMAMIAAPLLLGVVAWDVLGGIKTAPARIAEAEERISLERGVALAFVIAGGLFWTVASFAGAYSFRETGVPAALMAAFIPLVITAATLIVGWYFERATAVMLAAASLAVVLWGASVGFELGVWIIVTAALIGPMMTAAVLFWLARRDQDAFELSLAMQHDPELVSIAPTQGPQF